jgi:predicted permease
MVVESLLVAVPACAAGLGAAWAGLALLRRETVGVLPRLDQVGIDRVDVGLALGLALGGALAAGLLPAMTAANRFAGSAGTRSSSAGRESQILWRSFVAGQTALTLTLLVGCGLLLRSFVAAASVDLGYDPADVLTVDLTLPDGLYQDPDRRIGFYEQALADIRALPGVREVGLTSMQPFETSAMTGTVSRPGAEESVWTAYRYVDAGYFRALGIPLVRGEEIRPTEPETPEVILDAGLAAVLWPEGDALGGTLEWPSRVIGTVGSVREWNDERGIGTIYLHWRAFPDQLLHAYLMIRHEGSAAELAPRVRRALAAIDPMVPAEPQPLSGLVRAQLSDRRVLLLVALAFAFLASALAGTGVYAVVAFATSRRRREAAIRLSLGARRGEVGRTMMAQGMRPAMVGILIGLAGAWPVGVALRAQLFQVELLDPVVIGGAGGFLVAVACLAAWIPARRAARVQPGAALRPE